MERRGWFAICIALSLAMVLGMCPTRGIAEAIEGQPDGAIEDVEPEATPETGNSDEGVLAEAQADEAQTNGEQTQYVAEVQHPVLADRSKRYESIDEAIHAWREDPSTNNTSVLIVLEDCSTGQGDGYSVFGQYRALDLNGHTLDMSGRTFIVSSAAATTVVLEDNAGGGGIFRNAGVEVTWGTFVMEGGTLEGGSANGCIRLQNPQSGGGPVNLFLRGGTITNSNGAGVVATREGSSRQTAITMSGGRIEGCTGGGIVLNHQATLSVSGVPRIERNTKDGAASNVYLPNTKTITVAGPLADGASIGVTTETKPTAGSPVVITSGYGASNPGDDPSKYFTSDDPDYSVAWSEDKTEAVLVAHRHSWDYVASGSTLTATCTTPSCPARSGNKQTLTLSAESKTYDGKATVATTATSEGWASTGAVVGDVAYYQGGKKLGSAPVDAGDYEARVTVLTEDGEKTVTVSFAIRKANLAVTARGVTVAIGAPPTNAGVSYAGFVAGEGPSALAGSLAYDYGGYAAGSAAGAYPITPSGLSAANYAIAYEAGTLTVQPDSLPAAVPVRAVAHLQRIGTLPASAGVGQIVGTTGQSRRLESLRLSLAGQPLGGGMEYRAHIQRVGWQGWRDDGGMAGTEGRSRRLEAVQIRLTGVIANHYDVYYRVHVQRYGWMGWAKNGRPAGTTGESRRAEAVQIVVQRKGSPAPGKTYNGVTQTFDQAFEKE